MLVQSFFTWEDNVVMLQRHRHIVTRVTSRMRNRLMSMSFDGWVDAAVVGTLAAPVLTEIKPCQLGPPHSPLTAVVFASLHFPAYWSCPAHSRQVPTRPTLLKAREPLANAWPHGSASPSPVATPSNSLPVSTSARGRQD